MRRKTESIFVCRADTIGWDCELRSLDKCSYFTAEQCSLCIISTFYIYFFGFSFCEWVREREKPTEFRWKFVLFVFSLYTRENEKKNTRRVACATFFFSSLWWELNWLLADECFSLHELLCFPFHSGSRESAIEQAKGDEWLLRRGDLNGKIECNMCCSPINLLQWRVDLFGFRSHFSLAHSIASSCWILKFFFIFACVFFLFSIILIGSCTSSICRMSQTFPSISIIFALGLEFTSNTEQGMDRRSVKKNKKNLKCLKNLKIFQWESLKSIRMTEAAHFHFTIPSPPAHAHSASRTFFSPHPRSKDIAEKLYEEEGKVLPTHRSCRWGVRKAKLMMKFSKQANFLSRLMNKFTPRVINIFSLSYRPPHAAAPAGRRVRMTR